MGSLGLKFGLRVVALLLALAPAAAHSQTINVLWYTYAHPESFYKQTIQMLANVAHTLPKSSGLRWKLTFFGPDSPAPAFGDYNVLVIHSAEDGFTGRYFPLLGTVDPKISTMAPDYKGILKNRVAIEKARGERTFLTGSDADVHTLAGDTGNAPRDPSGKGKRVTCEPVITAPSCWDGALGHLVNAINWAGSGRGLGIVSFVAAEAPGGFWWVQPDSFLRAELQGHVTVWGGGITRENNPVIPAAAQGYALNAGLTNRGLGNWTNSFHAGFSRKTPGYSSIVDSTLYPDMAVAIATAKFASAGAGGPAAVPAKK